MSRDMVSTMSRDQTLPPPPDTAPATSSSGSRALLRMHNAATSMFALGPSPKIRVSRVFFSGPYQSCVRMRMQGVHPEMWPVSCSFLLDGSLVPPIMSLVGAHT